MFGATAADACDAMIIFPIAGFPLTPNFLASKCWRFLKASRGRDRKARAEFVRVMKAEAKRIKAYIQPEHGTTEIALDVPAQRNPIYGSRPQS